MRIPRCSDGHSVLCSLAVPPGSGGQHAGEALGPLSVWLGCSVGGVLAGAGPGVFSGGRCRRWGRAPRLPPRLTGLPPLLPVTAAVAWTWLATGPLDHRKCLANARGDGDAHGHATHGQSRPRARLPPRAARVRVAPFSALLWKQKCRSTFSCCG